MHLPKILLLALFLQLTTHTYSQFSLPLSHLTLTSGYGYRLHPVTGKYAFHSGVDLRAHNDTVFAIADGRVAAVGYDSFLGINVRLQHGPLQSIYGHLSQIFVLPADSIFSGQPIGITGATGRVTGEHLHFSLVVNGIPVDPIKFLYRLIIKSNY